MIKVLTVAIQLFLYPHHFEKPVVERAIQSVQPRLSKETAGYYASLIIDESRKHKIDPLLVVALIYWESNFLASTRNRKTNDWGLMQVHYQRVPWLKGVSPQDLLKPDVNIRAGIMELAYWRRWCNGKRGYSGHHWIEHNLFGNSVWKGWYGRRILGLYRKLKIRAETSKAQSRNSRDVKGVNKSRADRAMSRPAHRLSGQPMYQYRLSMGD